MQRRVCQHQKQGKRTCKHVETWTVMPFCMAIVGATLTAANPVLGQSTIVPDTTLGTENSTVNRDVMIRGILSDRVEGGAARGSNLFHSFEQFNVGAGRGIYFANPVGIENILSRVTGSNRSEVLGRLGVLGNANLFLLNPNGIMFGANASLDITGSFTATTANAIQLGDRGFFSATQPQQSTLLAITPGALLYNQIAAQGGRITNTGNLAAGQDLTLAANTLNLEGQLQAGRDLTLQAQDTVRIRDSAMVPFIASSGRNLLVQGNQTVDIFALNHPNSGLFSGGNMVLRSTNPVGGDAHYWSGGNFRIEQLNGILGELVSPYDPIIRSFGDVSFGSYTGASLHIFAGGSVIAGGIAITGFDTVDSIQENVMLSNGEVLQIDGGARPTVDIRAGINPAAVGVPLGLTGANGFFLNSSFIVQPPTITASATSANIQIRGIVMYGSDGMIFLTNQYQPNRSLSGGEVAVNSIQANDTFGLLPGNGGSVLIDGRTGITIGKEIITSAISGNAGDITLFAQDKISLSDGVIASRLSGGKGQGGTIRIEAGSLSVTNGAQISTSTFGQGNAGNVIIVARNTVSIDGTSADGRFASGAFSSVEEGALGKGGNVEISTGSLSVTNGALVSSSTFGQGDAGNVIITARDAARFDGVSVGNDVGRNAVGNGGNLILNAGSLSVTNGAELTSSTLGQGNAGNVIITVRDAARFDGVDSNGFSSFAGSTVRTSGKGRSGILALNVGSLVVSNGASLTSSTFGQGDAGDIIITVRDAAHFDGIGRTGFPSAMSSQVNPNAVGRGGTLTLNADSLSVTNGAQLSSSTFGQGDAGNITITVRGTALFDGVSRTGFSSGVGSTVQSTGKGNGGTLTLSAGSLFVTNGAQLSSSTSGQGNAGSVIITLRDSAHFDGIGSNGFPSRVNSQVDSSGVGVGGTLIFNASSLSITNGAVLTSSSFGKGNAGSIFVNIRGLLQADNGEISTTAARSSGGAIEITARDIRLRGDSDIATFVGSGAGGGGNITLTANSIIALEDSDILAFVPDGRGGDVTLNTRAFFGQNYRPAPSGTDPRTVDGNDRVDINNSGALIILPDTTFIQNSLTQLPQVPIDTNTLLANSCIVRRNQPTGNFFITGSGGLPERPGTVASPAFPTGEVQNVAADVGTDKTDKASPPSASSVSHPLRRPWKIGDPIVEPQGVYQLPDGQLVLSHACP